MNGFPLLISDSTDPSLNLALEELLIGKGLDCIYLWCNEPTVVIGRNQNPYRECNLSRLEEDHVYLERRRSGGGAVYHDLGNLNFTIISDKTADAVERNFALVAKVLGNFGIHAEVSGRNDLEVDGLKISGSAFFEDGSVFCHHGTLLVDVDMSRLSEYLIPSKLKLESKGIDSVRARVANLSEFHPGLSVLDVIEGFMKEVPSRAVHLSASEIENLEGISGIIERYRSWKWTYGESPEYNVKFEGRFSWGTAEMLLFVENGVVRECRIFTDSLDTRDFTELSSMLEGIIFSPATISDVIGKSTLPQQVREDFTSLIISNMD